MRNRVGVGVALVGLVVTMGCVRTVRRAGLMPRMQPIVRSGQPMTRTSEVALSSPTIVDPGEPEEVQGANAGVVVPRWNFNGAVRLSPRANLDIGLKFDWGLDAGSRAVRDDQPDPDRDVFGAGASMFYSADLGPQFRLGLAGELLLYSIPYVEYDTATNGSFSIIENESELIPVISLGVIPSYRISESLVIMLGVNLRNHPTIDRSDVIIVDVVENDEVEFGPMNVVAMLGAELTFPNGMRALAHVFQPVLMDPVLYKPAVGLSVVIPLTGNAPYQPRPIAPAGAPLPAGPMGP